jgi:ABC-type cobalamin/Fe3+-siderophores transport system ATPase subunit
MEGLLSLRDVWLSYPRGRRHVVRVLVDVSLDLRAGEVLSVIAQRAQGKTSLLRIAAGMERPDRGSVLFDGQDVWRPTDGARPRRLRRGRRRGGPARSLGAAIALVRAGPPEVEVPVLEAIALPLAAAHSRRHARELAAGALKEVGAGECGARSWSDLSDCERTRVAIAQALARAPRLLLVDDLTATLNLGETEQITALLHGLAAEYGIGVLMSVGDARATAWSERVATLAGGELLLEPVRTELEKESHSNVVGFPGS